MQFVLLLIFWILNQILVNLFYKLNKFKINTLHWLNVTVSTLHYWKISKSANFRWLENAYRPTAII